MTTMDCGRAEELLSDLHEGTLDPVLRADLESHLAACAGCRDLRDALAEVLDALGSPPVVEPSEGLALRVADAALAAGPEPPARRRTQRAMAGPESVFALAACLAVATSAAILWALAAPPSWGPARIVDRTLETRVFLLERKDRLVEDLRVLRVVIATAFEGRLERVNDRVDDYRRLLERRRGRDDKPGEDGVRSEPTPGAARSWSRSSPRAADASGARDAADSRTAPWRTS
jgi:hypothetical protein